MAQSRATIVKKVQFQKLFDANTHLSRAYFIHGVKYGNWIDIRQYKKVKVTFNGNNRNNTKRTTGTKRSYSLNRARVRIYRLIHANCFQHGRYQPIFTTYTFAEQCTEIDRVNAMFKLFVKRLEYYTQKKLQYLCVPEIQKEREKKEGKGVWHFHVIWFNLPWIDYKKHEDIWGLGWSQIEAVRSIRDIGSYVAKYLSKDIFESRLYGKKTFYTSRNLIRPQDYYEQHEIDNILKSCNHRLINRYECETYTQYKYKLC